MNEKKSNASIVAIVAVVAIVVLAVPCLLGALFLGGLFMWRVRPAAPDMQEIVEPPPPPTLVPEPQVESATPLDH